MCAGEGVNWAIQSFAHISLLVESHGRHRIGHLEKKEKSVRLGRSPPRSRFRIQSCNEEMYSSPPEAGMCQDRC